MNGNVYAFLALVLLATALPLASVGSFCLGAALGFFLLFSGAVLCIVAWIFALIVRHGGRQI